MKQKREEHIFRKQNTPNHGNVFLLNKALLIWYSFIVASGEKLSQ